MQLGLLALLVFACARVIAPFVGILAWAAVLAVLLYPLHLWLARRIGKTWSAWLIGIAGVVLAVAPMVMLTASLSAAISSLITDLQNHTLTLPPPPPGLAELPFVGERMSASWATAAENVPATLAQHRSTVRSFTASLVAFAGKMATAELAFILSFVIGTILVAYGESVTRFTRRLAQILTRSADQGSRLVGLTVSTIRGVALGIVGVAAIQAALLGVGFFLIGLPGAILVTLVVFLLGIVQVPAVIVSLPIIVYVFMKEPLTPALIFGVWTFVAGLSDNFLKPLLLGRGSEVPMPVILIGVIGGMVVDGLLGLFIGPVLLAVAYMLFMEWLRGQQVPSSIDTESAPS
ncbi:AI-2E family transporter [Brevundimonas sp. Root1423]|uniref:AI-2E family transporter n=1 Tax=Brevundimonas sp. Root1423 TaxID=1736462 RepID=UPI0019101A58|nr:AI-2E family transporter [Brevundimonas sp. Root1423]